MALSGLNEIKLWREHQILGGLDVLKAHCLDHHYPLHTHDTFVIASFKEGAQKHKNRAEKWCCISRNSYGDPARRSTYWGRCKPAGGMGIFCILPTQIVLNRSQATFLEVPEGLWILELRF